MPNFIYMRDWEVTNVQRTAETYVASATYTVEPDTCPSCGVVGELGRHGTKETAYKDAPVHGKQTTILAERRRYRCRACKATTIQPLPDIDDKRRMTKRCVQYIKEQALRRTFTQIAEDIGMDEKTVRVIAGEQIVASDQNRTLITPEQLGIDEVTVLKKPRAIFTDIAKRNVIDLLDNRNKPTIARWLSLLPHKERVKVVTIDMWLPYKDAVNAVLPKASVVVDKFHVVRMASQGLDIVRKRVGSDFTVANRRKLMRSRHLLLRRHKDLKPMAAMDLDGWLKNVPALQDAYDAKEAFFDIYDAKTKADAQKALRAWVTDLPADLHTPYKALKTAVGNWEKEILAFWDFPITNAYTEAANGVLKIINRTGRGYSFPVIRARILHVQGAKEETFICDECLGEWPLGIQSKQRHAGKTVCRTCHRLHTQDWLKRHGHST